MAFAQGQLKQFSEFSCQKLLGARPGAHYFAEPFKHVVIDDFFSPELAEACLGNFPALNDKDWQHSNEADIEVKYRTDWTSEFDIPEGIVDAVRILNSAPFLNAMSAVMEIPKIVPDPYFTGGGLNVTMRGGLLDVHVDGNYHDATGLSRRLNALVYLNPGWQEDWGGEFGVYDETGTHCLKKVAPLHNRLVIFDSHDKSFHGLPDPINFPEGEPRRSIILYYYTKEARPDSQTAVFEPHSALWKKRNLLDKRGNLTRNFN
jgi:Rps23 Pro-64 3,4-dihydroxylase Tpa1-like proline 4-hydroxylase